MENGASFTAFQDKIFASLMSSTKSMARLAAEDLTFNRSLDPSFAASLDKCNKTILDIANALLRNSATGKELNNEPLGDADDVETNWSNIVEVVDSLLEKADTCLDEYTGAIKQKNPEPPNGSARDAVSLSRKAAQGKKRPTTLNFRNRNILKPQLRFTTKVDNFDSAVFKPLLTTKPHAIVPLEQSLGTFYDDHLRPQHYHPYKTEIEKLQYPSEVYEIHPPINYHPFESTTGIMVDTAESLHAMLDELKRAKEIAVDLEHHSDRSFIGFVCLMQISTREKDWIIDTLKLRGELMVLNEVFADPRIVKVLHGAHMDILWLQRDFGLYIVGLFDTYEAAKALGFAGRGLAFLLKKYVGFDADKQYQLADWRIRPLPQEMLDYARSDTHFLLYCYDRVRNELVKRSDSSDFQNNLIGQVLLGSKETSLRRHEREIYDAAHGSGPNGWGLTLSRTPIAYNTEQMAVFKAVHEWRDKVARSEDESHHYVLPKHQLFNLARLMPEDVLGILGACHPASSCVRLRVSEILSVIQEARGEALPSQPKLNVAPVGTNNMQEAPEPPPSTALTNTKGVDISSIDIFSYEDISNQGHLRADVSNFWGSAVGSSKWSKTMGKAAGPLSDIRLPLPLPQLTAAIFLNPNDAKKLCDPGSMAEHEYTRNRPQQKDDSIIVVKQVGGKLTKRKREEAQPLADGLVAHYEIIDEVNSEDIQTPIDDIEETIVFSTTQSPDKEENKQRRKKKKGKEMESKDMQAGEEENVPFDYSKAASVLNGAAKDGNTSRGFNPYSKPGEGPKSGRRGRREKEGKTFTFQR